MTNDRSANRSMRTGMRWIFAGLIVLSASTAVVRAGEADKRAEVRTGDRTSQAPVRHRQPARPDVTGAPAGAGEVQPEESNLAKTIEQENDRLDRLVRGICRGC